MPASIIARSSGFESQAGPMVAMTLVFLSCLRCVRANLYWLEFGADYILFVPAF